MFSRSQPQSEPRPDSNPTRPQPAGDAPPSIISVDMKITGNLQTDGDVQIDGVVDGDVRSQSLSVGRTAHINGELVAEVVRIWGRVEGRVRGRDVALMETAEVKGDILHETLEVSRGAVIEGSVKRQTGDGLLAAPSLRVTDQSSRPEDADPSRPHADNADQQSADTSDNPAEN